MKKILFLLSLLIGITTAYGQGQLSQKSPNGLLELQTGLVDGKPCYSVVYNKKVLLENSPLGLKTSIGDFSSDLKYLSKTTRTIEEAYDLDRAKISRVNYKAEELVCTYENPANDTIQIVFRLSNNDVAFSYRLHAKGKKTNCLVFGEETGFRFPSVTTTFITQQSLPMKGWEQTKPSYEEEYTNDEPIGTPTKDGVGYTFPALFRVRERGWALVSETGVDSRYVGSRLGEGTKEGLYKLEFPQQGENNSIGATYAAVAMPLQTPWRTITVGETLKPIIESTVAFDVVKPLYQPSIAYKPGRATWSWIVWQDNSINYADQIKFIDLATALRFEYVLIDANWDTEIGRNKIVELVKYAGAKGVEIILWYNSNGNWNDAPQTPQDKMDTSPARKNEMAWLQSIGVKGLKVDFFGGDKQETIKLYEDILSDANEYGLAITFHGCTLPRGWERMYPNYVTSEAVLASENLIFTQQASDKYPFWATVYPFTRNAVGAMDFAPVFLNSRLSRDQKRGSIRRTTEAFELATAVLFFSPVQHFGLTPNNLDEQPGFVLDFLRKVPTVWDETVFIDGYPGKYCIIARRNGDKWYVAAVNGEKKPRKINISLPMLKDKEISLLFDKDDRKVGEKKSRTGKDNRIELNLSAEGGAVLFSD
ncbi:glycoside hydrolase family 97 protein [Viscerimonas tarda]